MMDNGIGSFLKISLLNVFFYAFTGVTAIISYLYFINLSCLVSKYHSTVLKNCYNNMEHIKIIFSIFDKNSLSFIIFVIVAIVLGMILSSVGDLIVNSIILPAPDINNIILPAPDINNNEKNNKIPLEYVDPCIDDASEKNVLYAEDIVNAINKGGNAGEFSEVYFATYNVFSGLGVVALTGTIFNSMFIYYKFYNLLKNNLIISIAIFLAIAFLIVCLIYIHLNKVKKGKLNNIRLFIKKIITYKNIYPLLKKLSIIILIAYFIILFINNILIHNIAMPQNKLINYDYSMMLIDLLLTIFLFHQSIFYYKKFANQIIKAVINN